MDTATGIAKKLCNPRRHNMNEQKLAIHIIVTHKIDNAHSFMYLGSIGFALDFRLLGDPDGRFVAIFCEFSWIDLQQQQLISKNLIPTNAITKSTTTEKTNLDTPRTKVADFRKSKHTVAAPENCDMIKRSNCYGKFARSES